MSYYHSKIDDISAPEVRRVFDDLCLAGGWPVGERYDLIAWRWLVLYFQTRTKRDVTQDHLPFESPLTTPIIRQAGNEVYIFCKELCRERKEGLELNEAKTVLTLLRKLYVSEKNRLGKVRRFQ